MSILALSFTRKTDREEHQVQRTPDETVLLESVRARITVAPVSLLGIILPAVLFVPYVFSQDVPAFNTFAWVGGILVGMSIRTVFSRRVSLRIDEMSADELDHADRRLRLSSIVNQALMGSGIWLIQAPADDTLILPLFVTLLQTMFLLGVMTNLFSDFRTFAWSAPLLMGQTAAFWLTQGELGFAIAISMAIAMALMYALQWRASHIFRQSVLMRFEKDELLDDLEEEKAKTEDALAEAQGANRSKAYFMAAASHDIKQPLYALGMLTDTLLMSEQTEGTRSILGKQRRNINKMTFMFDDLMDLSRFEQGVYKIDSIWAGTSELREVLDDEFLPQCKEKGLKWTIDLPDARIMTDPNLLLRLCRNLLNNAVRYTDSGEVCFRAVSRGETLEFEISDTGSGIAEQDQPRVFEQFVRVEEGIRDGAGLGLTIVKHIVDALGYDLRMDSEEGCGTTFRFSVPADTAQDIS